MGAGSTIAAATAIGYESIGIEIDPLFFAMAERAIPLLAKLTIGMNGRGNTLRKSKSLHLF
jgi:site-specific DNA-methyltransferase (adenine-specific)